MLRARDAMDRTYAQPLDVASLARDRVRVGGALHPQLPGDLRRDAAPLPAASPRRARDVPAARDRPQRDRHLLRRRLHQPGHVQPDVPRDRRPVADEYRAARPTSQAVPTCFTMAWTRPSSFGEAHATATRRSRRHVERDHHLARVGPRPGRGPRLLRQQARPRGQQRPEPRLHALADRRRARRPGARDPARAARAALDGRRRPPSRSASWSPRAPPASRSASRPTTAARRTRRCWPGASSSPRSRPSATTASISACATRSATTSASRSWCRRARVRTSPRVGPSRR